MSNDVRQNFSITLMHAMHKYTVGSLFIRLGHEVLQEAAAPTKETIAKFDRSIQMIQLFIMDAHVVSEYPAAVALGQHWIDMAPDDAYLEKAAAGELQPPSLANREDWCKAAIRNGESLPPFFSPFQIVNAWMVLAGTDFVYHRMANLETAV
jgi:hypothetical protein